MLSGNQELPPKSLQIRSDDKFFARLLTKENSTPNLSFRVYYAGASSSVPFVWESQPGTPKHLHTDANIPPLTPPPSYSFNIREKPSKSSSRSNLFKDIFPGVRMRKAKISSLLSSPSSLSTSSSTSTTLSSLVLNRSFRRNQRFSSPRSSFSSVNGFEEDEDMDSPPTSPLCFGFRGCHPITPTKQKSLLSIRRFGSSQGRA